MRFSWLSAWLSLCSVVWAAQIPLQAPKTLQDQDQQHHDDDYSATRTTLVDLLSASEEHKLLVQLLQRSRLIPTLNRIANQTFFAPSDDALRKAGREQQEPWTTALNQLSSLEQETEAETLFADNIAAELRKTLLYHLLNYTLVLDDIPSQPQLYETLLFPHPLAGHGGPRQPREPSTELPDRHSLLGAQGQKLRMVTKETGGKKQKKNNDKSKEYLVGVTADGSSGTPISPDLVQQASNGVLMPLDSVLMPPPSIAQLLKSHPMLRRIPELYSEDQLQQFAADQANLTLFAPADASWDRDLDDLERKYLKSGYATKDMAELWEKHVVQQSNIGYTDVLQKEGEATTISGSPLTFDEGEEGKRLKVNGSEVVEQEILAENGVVHVVPNLLLPEGSLQLTPEKVLLALNCSRFLGLLHSSNLSDVVQQNDEPFTILAPTDDILASGADRWASPSLPPSGSAGMKDLLRYHLLQGQWDSDELSDGMLLDTELKTPLLKEHRQKMPVSVTVDPRSAARLSASDSDGNKTPKTVGFAEANVLGDPIKIGNSIIYLVSKVLEPPPDVLQTAMTDLSLSTFVASVYAAGLDKVLKQTPATTVFAPVNEAFTQLGLAMNYLLLPAARNELRTFIRYHAIDEIAYMSELDETDDHRYSTLEGSALYASAEDGTVALRGPTVDGFPASGQIDPAKVTTADQLTSNGALHVVDQALLPPTLDMTIEKLMRGAKANTMIDLLEAVNMTWVMKGEPAPEDFFDTYLLKHKKHKKKKGKKDGEVTLEGQSYIVLCPLDHAFSRINLTRYLDDKDALKELVKLHVVPSEGVLSSRNPSLFPSDGRPLTLKDDAKYDSLLSRKEGGTSKYGTLKFLRFGLDGWMVGIEGAQGDARHEAARVVGFGRSTPSLLPAKGGDAEHVLVGGGLMTLDAVLEPYHPPWLVRFGPAILIALFAVMAATLVGLLAWRLWKSKQEQKYHIVVETDDQS